jgi:hypothetical protein
MGSELGADRELQTFPPNVGHSPASLELQSSGGRGDDFAGGVVVVGGGDSGAEEPWHPRPTSAPRASAAIQAERETTAWRDGFPEALSRGAAAL